MRARNGSDACTSGERDLGERNICDAGRKAASNGCDVGNRHRRPQHCARPAAADGCERLCLIPAYCHVAPEQHLSKNQTACLTHAAPFNQFVQFRCADRVDWPRGNPVRHSVPTAMASPELPPQLSAVNPSLKCHWILPNKIREGLRRVTTREPGDLPERGHPSYARWARAGRTSAVVTK